MREEDNKKIELIQLLETLVRGNLIQGNFDEYDLLEQEEKEIIKNIHELITYQIPYDNEEINRKITKIIRRIKSINPNGRIKSINPNEIIITENNPPINYQNIFDEKGFPNYNNIGSYAMMKLEKYAKRDNVEYVLDFFDKYLSIDDKKNILPGNSKLLVDLIVFFDKEAIDTISEFIVTYKISLTEIMKRSSHLFKEGRKYSIKRNIETPKGDMDSFIKLTKGTIAANGTEEVDKAVKAADICFKAPFECLRHNDKLLELYGINCPLQDESQSTLNGKNTMYILDRCIELGLFDKNTELGNKFENYILKHPNFLTGTCFPFKFYKIKRALDLGENIFAKNGGLKKELTSDLIDYNGIKWKPSEKSQKVTQSEITTDDLLRGIRTPKGYHNSYNSSPKSVFDNYYHYTIFTAKDSIRCNIVGQGDYLEIRDKIISALQNDNNSIPIDYSKRHPIVDMLDLYCKEDERTYSFNQPAQKEWPSIKICISRPKVIRLCNLLSKDESIIININDPITEDIFLAVLTKDSILSQKEYEFIRFCLREIIKKYNQTIGGQYDRFPKK